jgi:hypothetical protein
MRWAIFILILFSFLASSCHSSRRSIKVVKPVFHKTLPKNTHVINLRILNKNVLLFKRKRTRIVSMH